MATPTKTTTPAVRKRPTRPTMNKKSPYKAGKSSAKTKQYSTKKLSSVAKKSTAQAAVKAIVKMKSPTKQEKMLARQRAREWAKKELGKKKSSSSSPSPIIIVIDDDTPEDEKKPKTIQQPVLEERKDAATDTRDDVNVDNDDATEEEETFYDALEYLTSKKEDVAVEDVSDLEDDELRELQSTKRNLIPSHGEWMEPLEPDGFSYSTFSPEKDSKPKQESYKLFGIGIPFSTYESKEEP